MLFISAISCIVSPGIPPPPPPTQFSNVSSSRKPKLGGVGDDSQTIGETLPTMLVSRRRLINNGFDASRPAAVVKVMLTKGIFQRPQVTLWGSLRECTTGALGGMAFYKWQAVELLARARTTPCIKPKHVTMTASRPFPHPQFHPTHHLPSSSPSASFPCLPWLTQPLTINPP